LAHNESFLKGEASMVRQGIVATLLMVAPLAAAAQSQAKEQVVIRAVADPTMQLVASVSPDSWVFSQSGLDKQKQQSSKEPPRLQIELELETKPEQSLDAAVATLRLFVQHQLTVELVPASPKSEVPPHVRFVWGEFTFKGVLETFSVKYTMFLDSGNVARATATVSMKSGCDAKNKKECN
jgi:hypothetical protein